MAKFGCVENITFNGRILRKGRNYDTESSPELAGLTEEHLKDWRDRGLISGPIREERMVAKTQPGEQELEAQEAMQEDDDEAIDVGALNDAGDQEPGDEGSEGDSSDDDED